MKIRFILFSILFIYASCSENSMVELPADLRKPSQDEETGDGCLITTDTLTSLNLGKLKFVCSDLLISMIEFSAENLEQINGILAFIDNSKLTKITLPKLQSVQDLSFQRNAEIVTLNDAGSLRDILFDFDFQGGQFNIPSDSFSDLITVGNEISTLIDTASDDYEWLGAVGNCPLISVTGPVEGIDFCSLKSFEENNLGSISIRSSIDFTLWTNDWFITNCP